MKSEREKSYIVDSLEAIIKKKTRGAYTFMMGSWSRSYISRERRRSLRSFREDELRTEAGGCEFQRQWTTVYKNKIYSLLNTYKKWERACGYVEDWMLRIRCRILRACVEALSYLNHGIIIKFSEALK